MTATQSTMRMRKTVCAVSPTLPQWTRQIARQWPLKAQMPLTLVTLLFCILLAAPARGQNNVPTFRVSAGQSSYTLAGQDPALKGTTTIPTLLVPVQLLFEA